VRRLAGARAAIVAVFVAVFGALVMVGWAVAASARQHPTNQLAAMADGVESPQSSASGNHLPAAKQSILDAAASARAAATPSPKGTDTAAADNVPPSDLDQTFPPRVGGIFDQQQSPFPDMIYQVNNAWSGQVSGVWVVVYAGGPRPDPVSAMAYPAVHGAVNLVSEPLDPNAPEQQMTFLGEFPAPPGVGPLSATSVTGTTMTLTDPSGVSVHFDLVTHMFLR
jgi:hypothetical protein